MEDFDVINQLYGSLKTNIPYTDIKTVRKKAGVLLGKKYSVNLKKNERRNIRYKFTKVEKIMIKSGHSKYHSSNAFCGNAGPEEIRHLEELIDKLTDDELKQLTKNVGIKFLNEPENREQYEMVIDEAGREIFYREYRKIIEARKKSRSS